MPPSPPKAGSPSAMEAFHASFQGALNDEFEALVRDLRAAAGAVAEGSSEWGLGGGATPEWPPAPPDGHETVEEDDGYAAGAD